jgi:hypothetical protein
MATPVVLTTGARPITPVESGGVPMTPVDTLGEPVTVVDTLGEPVVLVNNDGTPAFLAYSAKTYLGGVAPYHWLDFIANRALYAGADVGNVTGATGYSFSRASQGYYTNSDGTLELFESGQLRMKRTADSGHNLLTNSNLFTGYNYASPSSTVTASTLEVDAYEPSSLPSKISFTGTGNDHAYRSQAVPANSIYSVWLRTLSGTRTVALRCWNTGATQFIAVTVTSTWQRFSLTVTSPEEAAIGFDNRAIYGASGTAGVIYAQNAQLNEGSSATAYVATTTTPVYAPRRGDRGVLIEGSRTNLLVRSQEFDNAAWEKIPVGSALIPTVTANQGAAPDGTTTADRVQFSLNGATASGDISILRQSNATTGALTHSVWLKSFDGSSSYAMQIILPDGGGQAITVTPSWQRFTVTGTSSGSVGYGVRLRGAQSPTNSNTADVLIWGAQLEAASFPSSYIPTVAAAATRAADSLSISDARSAPFTMFAEFEPVGTANQNDIIVYDTLTNGSGIYLTPTPAAWVRESSVTTAIATGGSAAVVGSVSRVAARFAVNDTLLCNAGTLGSADTSNSPPSTTVLKFAPSVFGGVQSVYLRRVAIIASGATNAQLQAMTT